MSKKEINVADLKKIYIFILAFIGFLTTIELSLVYFDANFNPHAMPSFCSINSFVDCDGVARTVHSQFFGIPLALWGMFLYLFIIFLLIVDKLKKVKLLGFLNVFKNPIEYISALGFISFAISMILFGVSLFEIKKICILCLFTYFLNLFIAIIATNFKNGFLNSFKISVKDFIDALKVKQYLASFILIIIAAAGILTYTTKSYVLTPQVKFYDAVVKYAEMKTNPYAVVGNTLGDENAKTIVYIYTDYRCPLCRIYNTMTHKVAKELSGFKIVHKNFPLDMECNKSIKTPFHVGSCMMAKYAIAAEKQNHFWDINSAFFEKQPQTEDDILDLAGTLGLDTTKLKEDANSPETKARLLKEIDEALALKINGTPTLVINGTTYIGLKPYYQLKNILLKAGAVERKN